MSLSFSFNSALQGIWVASIFVALPILIRTHKAVRATHAEILSGSAATGAVFAELFMIKSLLVFQPKARHTGDESSSPRWNTSLVCAQIARAYESKLFVQISAAQDVLDASLYHVYAFEHGKFMTQDIVSISRQVCLASLMQKCCQELSVVMCHAVTKQGSCISCSCSPGLGLGSPGRLPAAGYRIPSGHPL